MSVRRLLIQLALFAGATPAALSSADPWPVGVDLQTPALLADRSNVRSQPTGHGKATGLLVCSQTYDSATQVIGAAGGYLRGGYLRLGTRMLFVHSRAPTHPVRITAVAPADTMRWVRFQPDRLVFQTSPARHYGRADQPRQRFGDVDGWGTILYTGAKDCGAPLSDPLRIAQVTDSRTILGYLTTFVRTKRNPWSQANQYIAAVFPHFSNYAVAW
jgi:hypothetical protein